MVDQNWHRLFSEASLKHLISARLDHCPILLKVAKEVWRPPLGKTARSEIMWGQEVSFPELVKNSW